MSDTGYSPPPPGPPPTGSQVRQSGIYISRSGQTHGPYSRSQVEAWLAAGQVQRFDMACSNPAEGWRPLGSILGTPVRTGTAISRKQGLIIAVSVITGLLLFGYVAQKDSELKSKSNLSSTQNVPLPSPTPDGMTKQQHLERARTLVANGHGYAALDDIAVIQSTDPEFAEARKLAARAETLKKKENRESAQRDEQLAIDSREAYAREFETMMLEQYQDFYVRTSGPKSTILTIRYVLMSRPLVYKLTTSDTFMNKLRFLGFKKVVFTDGYYNTWTQGV